MGKRVVDDASLTAVADILRFEFPDEKFVFPDELIQGIDRYAKVFEARGYNTGSADGYTDGYNVGKANGLDEGAAICAAKHFVYNFVGDGSDTATFPTPFEPDEIQVFGFDPRALSTKSIVFGLQFDSRAFGQCAGFLQHTNASGGIQNVAFSASSATKRYSRAEDGTITITGVGTSNATVCFGNGFPYTVVAVKYTEQTDKERITAFVNSLTGGGTVSLQQAKVEAAFTDDEWAALIATKPDWTFTMI